MTFLRYAFGLTRARVDLPGAYLCKRAHVTRRLSRRRYRQWQEDKQVRCWCGRPAHPIRARAR